MCEVSARIETVENFPIWKNRKIFFHNFMNWNICTRKIFWFSTFPSFSKIPNFYLSGPKKKVDIFPIIENPVKFQLEWRWWKLFHFSNFFEISEILFIRAYKCVNFQTEWRGGNVSNKIRWIVTFPEGADKSPIGKFPTLLTFRNSRQVTTRMEKVDKFFTYSSLPLSVSIFRLNGEGRIFSNKFRWFRIFAECQYFPMNRKILHFTNFFQNPVRRSRPFVNPSVCKSVRPQKGGGKLG